MRVLIVEDEESVRATVRCHLRGRGHTVEEAVNGEDGLWAATELDFDAVVLDRRLPDADGLDVLRDLRERGRMVPVVVCSAADELPDRLEGLAAGADDYVVKPFALVELEARLHTIVRRGGRVRPCTLVVGDLEVDPAARTVQRRGRPIALRPRELAILEVLARRAGEAVSRAELLDQVWDMAYVGMSNVVDVHIRSLRAKVDRPFDCPRIETVHGTGYRLRAD